MKKRIQNILQRWLGFERYLYYFAHFKIQTFKWDVDGNDFFFFLSLLPPQSHALDVGSNIGITTVLMAKQLKHVYSFEPLPPNFKTLSAVVNSYQLKNVSLFQLAVGDETAEVEMVLPEVENVQMQGLSHVVHNDLTDFNEGKRFKAQLRPLDSFEAFQTVKIEGIKLDVENFEFFALNGARALLLRDKPLIYTELWENENRYKCFDLMKELGYAIKIHEHNTLVDYDASKHTTQNFFFVAE